MWDDEQELWHLLSKNAREFDAKPYVRCEKRRKRRKPIDDQESANLTIVMRKGRSSINFDDEPTCLMCCAYASRRDVVFLPCHHIGVCLDCSKKLHTCPMCRQKCASKVQIESLKCFECHQEPHEFCARCARLYCTTCETRCNCTKHKIYKM